MISRRATEVPRSGPRALEDGERGAAEAEAPQRHAAAEVQEVEHGQAAPEAREGPHRKRATEVHKVDHAHLEAKNKKTIPNYFSRAQQMSAKKEERKITLPEERTQTAVGLASLD